MRSSGQGRHLIRPRTRLACGRMPVEAFGRYRKRSVEAAAQNLHHDQRRAYLLDLLREGFGIEVEEVELERNVKVAEARGRIDLLYRDLVFEVKRDLKKEHDDVVRELALYLSDRGHSAFGLATDGLRFEAYRLHDGYVERFAELDIAEATNQEGTDWLDAYLFSQESVTPTAEDVVRRFGPNSAVFLAASAELGEIWDEVKEDSTVAIKRDEWDRLLRVVYGSPKGSDELFVRHTYLALVARLFAYLAIARATPRSHEGIDVVTGAAFQRLGIRNLVEDDFFAWVTEGVAAERAKLLVAGLARHLSLYETEFIDEDLLKQLYETLVDPVDRHDLGEFYTPDWLADLVLREAGFRPGVRMLDPSCGSGTFLFLAIRLLREAGLEGGELVAEAQRILNGLDVHPLAITVARANFVLALRGDLKAAKREVVIPIWMADSLAMPEQSFGRPIEVTVAGDDGPQRFVLPTEMEHVVPGSLAGAIARLGEFASPDISDKDAAAGFQAVLTSLGVAEFAPTWIDNLGLLRKLLREGRDTIWSFVLSNAARPQMLANNPVDLVVGNPPWLALRDLAEASYRERVTRIALDYGLLEKRRGWQTGALELATVFACFSIDHYLRTDGSLGFVLPRGVLFGAKQHEPFRKLTVRPGFRPEGGLDLEDARPLFKVPACVAFVRKGSARDSHWQVRRVTGNLPRRNASEAETTEHLSIADPAPLDTIGGAFSSYLDKAVQGATLAPRPFWFVEPVSGEASDRPYMRTTADASSRAKAPWTGVELEGTIEADFVFATALSVFPFRLGPVRLLALPVEVGDKGLRLLSPEAVLRKGATGLHKWLRAGEEIWESRKKDSAAQGVRLHEYLDNHRNLTRQQPGGTWLAYGADGSHVRAVVLDTTKLLKHRVPRPRAFIFDMNQYAIRVKSPTEAHYLAATLNSPFVDDAIKSVQTRGAWGARHIHRRPFEKVPIPEFDHTNAGHRRLAQLSEEAHERLASEAPARTWAKQVEPVNDLVDEADALARAACRGI